MHRRSAMLMKTVTRSVAGSRSSIGRRQSPSASSSSSTSERPGQVGGAEDAVCTHSITASSTQNASDASLGNGSPSETVNGGINSVRTPELLQSSDTNSKSLTSDTVRKQEKLSVSLNGFNARVKSEEESNCESDGEIPLCGFVKKPNKPSALQAATRSSGNSRNVGCNLSLTAPLAVPLTTWQAGHLKSKLTAEASHGNQETNVAKQEQVQKLNNSGDATWPRRTSIRVSSRNRKAKRVAKETQHRRVVASGRSTNSPLANSTSTVEGGSMRQKRKTSMPRESQTEKPTRAVDEFIPCGRAFSAIAGPWADTTLLESVIVKKHLEDYELAYPCLSVRYRDPTVFLSKNRLSATAPAGWSSIFGTVSADCGSWYYEVSIDTPVSSPSQTTLSTHSSDPLPSPTTSTFHDVPMGSQTSFISEVAKRPHLVSRNDDYAPLGSLQTPWDDPSDASSATGGNTCLWHSGNLGGTKSQDSKYSCHVRVGWSCRYCRYDLPVGHSGYSVSLCSVDGSVIHKARRHVYANTPLVPGDVVGCFIHLSPPTARLPDPRLNHALHSFVESGMLCHPEHPPMYIPSKASFVEFAVNGTRYGVAPLPHLNTGEYHPACSFFNGAAATVNFGPKFKYDPNEQKRVMTASPRNSTAMTATPLSVVGSRRHGGKDANVKRCSAVVFQPVCDMPRPRIAA